MKKFKFSMLSILNVKTALREVREGELADARAELRKQEEKLEEIRKMLAAAQSCSGLSGAESASFFVQRERYIKRLKENRKRQIAVVDQAGIKVEKCLIALKDAIVEEKKMEKAREKEHKAWELEFFREEQKNIDEMGSQGAFFRNTVKT